MGAFPGIKMAGNGNSAIVLVNPVSNMSANPTFSPSWSLGIIVTLSSGASLTYTVQVTGDQQPSVNGNWNSHDTLLSQTSSGNGSVAFPITGVRLNVSSYVSGTANLAVVQWP